jgi:hypothetical protein
MNPEFERNLWIELTGRRLILMPVVLGLIFLAASSTGAKPLESVAGAAEWAYYFLVILWGTRLAAGAVANEIRERTWDGQRLSALTPFQMLGGKLFGAPSYQWYGGLLCLPPIAAAAFAAGGPTVMAAKLLYLFCIGLFAQSMALLASLIAIHRRQALRRLDIFIYQVAGLATALIASSLWNSTYVARLLTLHNADEAGESIAWWGRDLPLDGFYLVSLFVFLGWSLLGNLTLLRSELQVRTSPIPWIAFLLFAVIYAAGFADGEPVNTARLAIAILVSAGLTYAAILSEHKDPVLYRWLLAELGRGRLGRVFSGLQCWMIALTLLTVLVAYFTATFTPPLREILGFTSKLGVAVAAGYFFVLRDVGVFLYFNMAPQTRRGDFAALITLGVFYIVLPVLAESIGPGGALALFYPVPEGSPFLMLGAPVIEAALVWMLALSRLRALLKR